MNLLERDLRILRLLRDNDRLNVVEIASILEADLWSVRSLLQWLRRERLVQFEITRDYAIWMLTLYGHGILRKYDQLALEIE